MQPIHPIAVLYLFSSRHICFMIPGPWFNRKMLSYQFMKSHCGDKKVVRWSYLHNGIFYTGKMASLYCIVPQVIVGLDGVLLNILSLSYTMLPLSLSKDRQVMHSGPCFNIKTVFCMRHRYFITKMRWLWGHLIFIILMIRAYLNWNSSLVPIPYIYIYIYNTKTVITELT